MFDTARLFSLFRGPCEEIRVDGEIVVHDGHRVIFQSSDYLGEYPMRSLLKPFQLVATGLTLDTPNRMKWVPCVGSISATETQVAELRKWYQDANSKFLLSKLKLTSQLPVDEENRVKAKLQRGTPSPFFHMCFSKHMAILLACQKEGWSLDAYTEVEHPYQKSLFKTIESNLGNQGLSIRAVVDGCKLPSPVLNLSQMAKLYQTLASSPQSSPLSDIKQMMISYPEWVGGPERVDTLLMQRNKGLVAKEGADGLLGLAVPPSQKYPEGLGIVVKIFAGFQMKLAAIAIAPILKSLGLNAFEDYSPDHRLEFHYQPFEKQAHKCWDISPLLSDKLAVWPGDQKFERKIGLDTLKGNHLTLSNITTTLHVGAHTDAVNHTEKVKSGIDTHHIQTYCGSCQVIEVQKKSAGLIEKKDFEDKQISAKRILFKTNSFPDPHHFNEDFVSLSEGAIEYLKENGVILVGIDTPSIDPFSSKELPAHHTVFNCGMAILEGIVLKDVEEGLYHLSAVPLKIKEGDASPVRAFLTPI